VGLNQFVQASEKRPRIFFTGARKDTHFFIGPEFVPVCKKVNSFRAEAVPRALMLD